MRELTCGCCGKYAKGKKADEFIDPDDIIRTQQIMELDGKNFLQLLLPEIPNSKVSYITMMFCPDCAREIKKAMGDAIANVFNSHAEGIEEEKVYYIRDKKLFA